MYRGTVLCVYRRQGSERSLVVRLPEGGTQCLPVAWTDRAAPNAHALGHAPGARLSGPALLEVLRLLEAWHAVPGYLTPEQYERNVACLAANRNLHGGMRHKGSAREGKSLLQGIVVCGPCGRPMNVVYRSDGSTTWAR